MLRVVVAPCSPFSVSRGLMRDAAGWRASAACRCTRIWRRTSTTSRTAAKIRHDAAEYAEDLGWVGHDVWHAHCVQLDDAGIGLFARTGTGVAHCPCSNMRLASGIAPIGKMRAAGVPVGLGVDGSASNDGAQMVAEVRQALLLQRVGFGPDAMTARDALEIATLGGAKVLNRDDIGALKPGMAADFAAFDLRQPLFAGALHDPVAALVFCAPSQAAYTVVNGKVVVREGRLATLDLPPVIERHNALAQALVRRRADAARANMRGRRCASCRARPLRLRLDQRARRFGNQAAQPAHFVRVMAAFVPQLVVLHRRKVERGRHDRQRQELRVMVGEQARRREDQVGLHEHIRREVEVRQRDDHVALEPFAREMHVDRAALADRIRRRREVRRVQVLIERKPAALRERMRVAHQANDFVDEQVGMQLLGRLGQLPTTMSSLPSSSASS
jgi:hypothetical protein